MSKVVVYTQAYNAENTLRRSLDSVLNQTFRDLTYYVGDNCSTDETRSIIREYAARDSRVRPIYYDVDDKTGSGMGKILCSIEHIRKAADFEWFCILDADDVYEPEFLREMLSFSKQQDLDMAVCSSRFIRADTGEQVGLRTLGRELVVSGAGFGDYFPYYHQFMRTTWAKLIRRSAVDQADLSPLSGNLSVGVDTRLAFEFLRHCQRLGVSSKLLHNYVISPTSASYRLDANRAEGDAIQHCATIAFLKEKVGGVSLENLEFLYYVYYNAVVDTLNVILGSSNAGIEERLAGIRTLFSTNVALEMLGAEAVEINKRRSLIEQLLAYLKRFGNSVVQYEDAIWLGMTFASLIGDQKEYVGYSKLQIQYLLNNKRWQEAEDQLSEWETILPDDSDLLRLRSEMEKVNIKHKNIGQEIS